ncbi:MAG TPA: type 2 lanthipeptide synthetase LanM family protein, partial [Ktedonobacteraceae bacterium]|nr:type 2 lanthipeptide synthetase LanM family protein [Ktedonobacteraceae bacterium]
MMDKNTLHQSLIDSPIKNTAGWYRAFTLRERLAGRDTNTALNREAYQDAVHYLHTWKEQAPFDTGSWFAERLAIDGITEDEFIRLLAESDEELQTRLPDPPAWLVTLAEAYACPASSPFSFPSTSDHSAFLRPFDPLLHRGMLRLQNGVQQAANQAQEVPFEVETLCSLFAAQLHELLLSQISRTLVLEMHTAKLRGQLQGETPHARFESYIRRLSQPGVLYELLSEYCVLARQLVLTIERWLDVSLELLRRLTADWSMIRETFAPQRDPGLLVQLSGGAGDLHRGGRSVSILEFSSGFRVVYKPKSLAIDQHFQELLIWLNAHGQQPALLPGNILHCGEYGWAEFITPVSCDTQEQVERFYERQGSYIALLYALKATDMHYENVLAAGEYPILIDLEAIFHPTVAEQASEFSRHPTQQVFNNSVLHTGLLPFRVYAMDDVEGIDISGLGGEAGQLIPFSMPAWENAGTDQMRLVRKKRETGHRQNRPTLGGKDVQALDYCEQIVRGFTFTYRLLMAHNEELQRDLLPRFAHDEVRFLARATRVYALFLFESLHPNELRDGLQRERLFDRLWASVKDRPYLRKLIAGERTDLQQGDIPFFVTTPGSHHVWTSRGKQIDDFFAQTGLEAASQRLAQLSEEDLARQRWMIQATFTSVAAAIEQETKRKQISQPSHQPVTRERLIAAACAVGDHICELAIWREGAAGWLGVAQRADLHWDLQPADTSLYHGNTGIALFLAYLGSFTGNERYTEHAAAALTTIRYDLERLRRYPRFIDIGAFYGIGSIIYLFTHLGMLWDKPELFSEAESLQGLVSERIAHDKKFSLLSGAAGAIACLLTLYSVFPTESLIQVARRCGDHLVARAQRMEQGIGWQNVPMYRPLTGFSNGAAGIAYSLLRLAQVSGEERFHQRALEAFAYERSLFSQTHQNWPVLFTDPQQEASFRMAWNYGAPGIGLSRLASLPFVDDSAIREEITTALNTIFEQGIGHNHAAIGTNHSAGRGDAGCLETVLVATQVLSGSRYQKPLKDLTQRFLTSIETYGYITGLPLHVETPGFMIGLAGIGYELLRLAVPEKTPSVLLLAPP